MYAVPQLRSPAIDAGTLLTEYYDQFELSARRPTTITYTYDPLYRITNAHYSGAYTYTFGYIYDAVGNRTVQTLKQILVPGDTLSNLNGHAIILRGVQLKRRFRKVGDPHFSC